MHSKVDYRIQGIHHAAVKQDDDARRQLISRLVYQIRNHPNKDALIADMQQDHPYNPFSEVSSEGFTIWATWNISRCAKFLPEYSVVIA